MPSDKPLPDFSLRATFGPPAAPPKEATRAERKEFFRAIEAGDIQKISDVIAQYPDAPNWHAPGGRNGGLTPLCVAVYDSPNPQEIMTLLLEKGADVNKQGLEGMMPLDCAAYSNKADLAEFLIRHGAEVEGRGELGGMTPLMLAAYKNARECADLLVIAGASVNRKDRYGQTAAAIAEREGHKEIVGIMQAAAERLKAAEAERAEKAGLPETGASISVSKPLALKQKAPEA